jgi:hypothetical protein
MTELRRDSIAGRPKRFKTFDSKKRKEVNSLKARVIYLTSLLTLLAGLVGPGGMFDGL